MTAYNNHDATEFQDRALSLMTDGLDMADLFINRDYLIQLNRCPVLAMDEAEKSMAAVHLFEVTKIVFDRAEDINQKLVSVYSALSNFGSSAILLICGSSSGVQFYIGCRDLERSDVAKEILQKALKGNFPGIKMRPLGVSKMESMLKTAMPERYKSYAVSSVSIVPSTRDNQQAGYIQGLEKFIDAMAGETYTAVFIAKPKSKADLAVIKKGYEEIHTALSQCEQANLSYNENQSEAIAESLSTSLTKSVSDGVTKSLTQSTSDSENRSRSRSSGMHFGIAGFGLNRGKSYGDGRTLTNTTGTAEGSTFTETNAENTAQTNTTTSSAGSSLTMTITSKNKTVKTLLDKIDHQLKRIQQCEAYGLWDMACYFIAPQEEVCMVAANTFKALVSGKDTSVEDSFVNHWSGELCDKNNTLGVLECLRYGTHPRFEYQYTDNSGHLTLQSVTPASLVSGLEMTVVMGVPHKSVNGLVSVSSAEFGRNVYTNQAAAPLYKNVNLGAIFHMGEIEPESRVKLDLNSLTAHCFVTGSTGSGKSNTIYRMIEELTAPKNNITFLVIEPAKGEYKQQFYAMPDIQIFTTNPKFCRILSINPFAFNEKVHILEHLDRLIEIFSACWPLYAAMPALLKASFEQAYRVHGWDLSHSIHFDKGNGKFPCFQDVVEILPHLLENSAFSAETKGDYIGSLVTRVQSLTNGLIGQIFNSDPIPDETLFDHNTIVDISRIGSAETKALIMGTLILKLNEYRQSETSGSNLPLRHITILEEAHNLLKRTSTEQGQESANVQGKSVEMISQSIAEMRTYGEGFIIVDQSPTAVDISAIKNTNTKIIMRLPEQQDREAAGASVGLSEEQIRELSRLDKGVAVVYQNNWLEAVLSKIDRCSDTYHVDIIPENDLREQPRLVGAILSELIQQDMHHFFVLGRFEPILKRSSVPNEWKEKCRKHLREYNRLFRTKDKQKAFSALIFHLLECEPLYRAFEDSIPVKEYVEHPTADEARQCKEWCDEIYNHLGQYAVFSSKQVQDVCFFATLIHMVDYEVTTPRYGYLLCCIADYL